jgi:hypothetical protein
MTVRRGGNGKAEFGSLTVKRSIKATADYADYTDFIKRAK